MYGTTKYNEKENIPCHCHKERICTNDKYHKEKMRGRRPGDNDDNRLSFTSSVHHFPRRLKSLKKSGFEMITFFTQLFVYRCFQADTKKLTDNLGGWNYTLSHADVMSGSVPDVLSESIFSHFLLSSYSALSRQWRQGTQ